jgi:hypothetical protein
MDDECAAPRRVGAGTRWLSVVLRGVHLVTVIWLGAALLGGNTVEHQAGVAVLVSGLLLWALDSWTKPQHLRQMAGLSMFLKLALIAAMLLLPAWRLFLFWLVVVWSAVFSHAPASFRNAPILAQRGRRDDKC